MTTAAPRRAATRVFMRIAFCSALGLATATPQRPAVLVIPRNFTLVMADARVAEMKNRYPDFAIAFVRGHSWIHSFVIGMETLAQLKQNLDLFAAPPLTEPEIAMVRRQIPVLPDHLLDPAQWPRR